MSFNNSTSVATGNNNQEDSELLAIRERVKQMEEESAKLKEMLVATSTPAPGTSPEEADARSVYVGNVDYTVTVDDLTAHFASCGAIARCTILCDKRTGHPKGFAYLEFVEEESVQSAVNAMNETLLNNRLIKVLPKRTNIFGFNNANTAGSGHPGGFRGGFRGGRGRGSFRGRGIRGRGARGRSNFAPY